MRMISDAEIMMTPATITASSPGVRSRLATGTGFSPGETFGWSGRGRMVSETRNETTAQTQATVKRKCVGGTVAEPPAQPTIYGPAPWPIAPATM